MSLPAAVAALMDDLERRGVRFGLRAGRLALDAPRGVLTPEVRALVAERKAAIERLVRSACEPAPSPPPRPAPRPATRCYVCRSLAWWQRPDGGWVCGVCHPGPARAPPADAVMSGATGRAY